jgi:selenocysteine lyase/cysteine desulfurase
MIDRRDFLRHGALLTALGLGCRTPATPAKPSDLVTPAGKAAPPSTNNLSTWEGVRAQFSLSPGYAHLAGFFLAAHPAPVRKAIDEIRSGLDSDAYLYIEEHYREKETASRQSLADYLGADPAEFSLTESTTAGLGLLYGGLQLLPGQDILTTTHDHYSSAESLRLSALRSGAKVRQVALHEGAEKATTESMIKALKAALSPKTRVLAVTWVHSSTGLKLPLRAIADLLSEANRGRDEKDRTLLFVDGVHGVGVDGETVAELGCDFLVSGCHKWLYGPRGTGFIWGKKEHWALTQPIVPSFSAAIGAWIQGNPPPSPITASLMTPGGFHAFEHRWAIPAAVKLHQDIGKKRVGARIHELNRQLKEGLAKMPHVALRTPMQDELSAGIVCFDIQGLSAEQTVEKLLAQKVVGSVPPYPKPHARLSANLANTPEDVEAALRAVRSLA